MNGRSWFTTSGVSRRLIISVVLFSTLVTLLISLVQLYRDYRTDINLIENQLQQVKNVHVPSLSASLWSSDINDLKTQAEGIMRMRDMQYLEVSDSEKQWLVLGSKESNAVILRSFPLMYQYRGRDHEIGTITVVASLEGVYQRLLNKVAIILVSNGVKTFLVAIFILFILHRLVTRHLLRIAEYSEKYDINSPHQQLKLERKPRKKNQHDELDVLVESINGMQLRLKESLDELHESTEHYRSLVESSYAIPWEVDIASFCFTYTGPQARDILGYEPEEWYQPNFWTDHMHPEDKDDALAYCQIETTEGRNHEFEYRMIARDGNTVWLRDDVIVVKENGVPVRLQGYMFDITAQKNAEIALQHAYDDLEAQVAQRTTELRNATEVAEKANYAKTEFLSRMSHELRTPLNAVLGFGQLLEEEVKDRPEALADVKQIITGGRHLLELIEEVMDLSRIELGQININIEDIELSEVVDEVLLYIQPRAERRGISIHCPDFGDARVVADKVRLKEILLNLLSNAVKYNNDNGSITIDFQSTGQGRCNISVADTGPGLNDSQLVLLFEPFSRLGAEYSGIEGTGIGLTISRRLAGLMDGELTVESEPGKGTAFTLALPGVVTTAGVRREQQSK